MDVQCTRHSFRVESSYAVRHCVNARCRIYESEATISPDLDRTTYAEGERHVMTHIYFLLTAGNVSRLHRIASDELWHFYAGDPLTVVEASKDSTSVKTTTIGSDPSKYDPCYVVPGGTWFGSRPEGEWSLGEFGAENPLSCVAAQHAVVMRERQRTP